MRERSCKADRNRNCPEHLLAVPFVGGFDARCIDCEQVQICSKFFFDAPAALGNALYWLRCLREDSGDPMGGIIAQTGSKTGPNYYIFLQGAPLRGVFAKMLI